MAKKTSKPARKSRPDPPPPPSEEAFDEVPPPPEPDVDDGPEYTTLGPERDLSKKKKEELIRVAQEHGGHLWDVMVQRFDEVQRSRGSGPNQMLQTEKLVVGIPMPSLSMEYLLGVNCFPLMLILQLVGEPHAGKSGLIAEFHRWFDEQSGGGYYNEAETKHSPHWFVSIMGQQAYDRLRKNKCDSIEDWQEHLSKDIARTKKVMDGTKEEPGVGRGIPVLYTVDTVMGKPSRRTQHKLEKEGSADLVHPWDAGIITTWLRGNSHILSGWPFAIVLANHLKYGVDEHGEVERKKAGGTHISFQETVELQLDRRRKLACADWEGRESTISVFKNSLGPTDGRRANVRYLWWFENDPVTGGILQKTIWDWHHSTVDLLNYLMNSESSQYVVFLRNRLKDAGFHINCPSVSPVENKAWSKNLGMKSEKDAVPWNDLGQAIAADSSLMKLLRKALAINEYPYLTGDIRQLLTDQAKEVE